jgi:hypothetical protein
MIVDGVLAGERFGRSWMISRSAVEAVRAENRRVGRPWSAVSSWAALKLAEGDPLDQEDAVARSRAKQRLQQGLPMIAMNLAGRSEKRAAYVHPSGLDRLREDARLVIGGAHAAASYGADLISNDLESYVRVGDLAGVVDSYGLDFEAQRPNVLLRVVPDGVWPFGDDVRMVGPKVAAIDLLESGDERAQRAGHALLESR